MSLVFEDGRCLRHELESVPCQICAAELGGQCMIANLKLDAALAEVKEGASASPPQEPIKRDEIITWARSWTKSAAWDRERNGSRASHLADELIEKLLAIIDQEVAEVERLRAHLAEVEAVSVSPSEEIREALEIAIDVLRLVEANANGREAYITAAIHGGEAALNQEAASRAVSGEPTGKRWTEVLCTKCGGNGVIKIPGGVSECPHCEGRCYEPEAASPSAAVSKE